MRTMRYPSPLRCQQWGCLSVIAWADPDGLGGWCDAHVAPHTATPIRVGVPGSFLPWPLDVRTWCALVEQGAIDAAAWRARVAQQQGRA